MIKTCAPILYGFLICILYSCNSTISIDSSSARRPYDWEAQAFHTEVVPYRHSDTLSVYIRLDRKELLYSREDKDSPFISSITVDLNSLEWNWIDTLKKDSPRWLDLLFQLSAYVNENISNEDVYSEWLEHSITDENRNASVKGSIELGSEVGLSRWDILIWDTFNDKPITGSSASIGSEIKIISNEINFWRVNHIIPSKSLPAPPFTGFKNPLDTLTAPFFSSTQSDWIVIEGCQQFVDITSGLTWILHGRNEDFPEIKDVKSLMESTRYIATRKEFAAMKNASQPKEALDNFWLSCGGSPEKTRELIKTYYGRVEEANRFFSGLLEGWRTDRGMIHIIYGVPNRVRRDFWNEYWIYGEEGTSNTQTFRFSRKPHELDNNKFRLERNMLFRTTWDRMITSWRNGRVHRD